MDLLDEPLAAGERNGLGVGYGIAALGRLQQNRTATERARRDEMRKIDVLARDGERLRDRDGLAGPGQRLTRAFADAEHDHDSGERGDDGERQQAPADGTMPADQRIAEAQQRQERPDDHDREHGEARRLDNEAEAEQQRLVQLLGDAEDIDAGGRRRRARAGLNVPEARDIGASARDIHRRAAIGDRYRCDAATAIETADQLLKRRRVDRTGGGRRCREIGDDRPKGEDRPRQDDEQEDRGEHEGGPAVKTDEKRLDCGEGHRWIHAADPACDARPVIGPSAPPVTHMSRGKALLSAKLTEAPLATN